MIEHIRGLAIFAKVAQTGSFRGAARALSISPSVVSQQIATLEARLGVALVYRSTRVLSLTSDGEALLASAQAVVREAENGLSRFSQVAAGPVGELNITLPEVMSLSPMTDMLAAFSAMYPGIVLNAAFSDTQLNPIREGYDLAIRVGWLERSALKSRKFGEIARVLVASKNYLKGRKAPSSPQDLNEWDFIRFNAVTGFPVMRRHGHNPVTVSMNSRISVSNAIAAYRFACADSGVTVALDFLARDDLERGRLVQVLPDWQVDSAGIHVVWPPNAAKSSLAMCLIDFLESRFAEMAC